MMISVTDSIRFGMRMLSILIGVCAAVPATALELFTEDFEGLTLMPVVTFESELRERNAWQTVGPNGPDGWTEVNLTTSVGDSENGVLEFEGWRFVNKEWWINTSGGQDRTQYLNGFGIIAVADPDEWDDFGNPDQGSEGDLLPENGVFDSTLRTPAISLGGLGAGETVKLNFSSSWRDEDQQTATLTAVYDTGDPEQLDLWTSVGADPNFKDDATNENLTYDLQAIPSGASSVQFEFRLQGNNDWWWAIDNVRVFTGDDPGEDGVLRSIIDRDTGNVRIVNNTGLPVDLRGFSLRSQSGVFDEANATFLSVTDPNWLQATQPGGDINDLSELHLDHTELASGGEINFGDVWQGYFVENADVTFDYLIEGSDDQLRGIVQFVGNNGLAYELLDLNFDGDVNILDWETFKAGYGSDLSGLTRAVRYAQSDLDNDGLHTLNDFLTFQQIFETANGSGSFAAMIQSAATPEPSSLLLGMTLALCGAVALRRRIPLRPGLVPALACALALWSCQKAEAQLVLLDEDFETSVTLGPFQEEGVGGNVWTDVPPAGWTTDNSGVPGVGDPATDGVSDWSNWAFVNKDAWIAADDQGRSAFAFGSGNVMVADPDEWDDLDGPARDAIAQPPTPDDLYDVFATTQAINIPPGIPAGRIKFSFDSSWRGNEFQDDLDGNNNQRATITAIYDGGTRRQILTWDSDPESDDLNPNAENQRLRDLDLQYDGSASTLQLEFALTDAWNDWWWAVDNLLVSVPTDPAVLRINTANGAAFFGGDDVIPSSVTAISVLSPSGLLSVVNDGGLATTISETADGPDVGSTPGDSPGEQWELLTSTSQQYAEAFLFGNSAFDNSRSESVGRIVNAQLLDDDPATAAQNSDISFTYSLATGALVDGIVEFFFDMPPGLPGDFNGDGVVGPADYVLWRNNLGESFDLGGNGNETGASAGVVDGADYDLWKQNYGSMMGASSAASVPEPATALLLSVVAVVACMTFLRGNLRSAIVAAAFVSCTLGQQASAQLPPSPFLDRDYQFGDSDVGATIGQSITQTDDQGNFVTFDSAGQMNQNQLIDLIAVSPTSRRATYVDTSDRPDGQGGIGLELNPLTFDRQYLRTGFGEALNFPEQSPSSAASLINPGGTINYFRINDRGFELWAKPTTVSGEHHIVMDSQQHGVLINEGGNFSMRYASRFEVETTQLPGPDGQLGTADDILQTSDPVVTPANYDTEVQAVAGEWYHLSVVRPFGPGQGSIFYVNGVAEAIAFGTYAVETIVNIGEGGVFTNIDSLDTSPLTVGRATSQSSFSLPLAESFFFRGVVDDLKVFVMGLNDDDNLSGGGTNQVNDYGEYIFQRDNGYAQAFAPTVDGDLNGDDAVTIEDADLFAASWLFENRLSGINPFNDVVSSRLVGDLSTRAFGDFDYNGIVNLDDWAILNNANPAAGAAALRLIAASVPEPSLLAICALGLLFLPVSRQRRRPH